MPPESAGELDLDAFPGDVVVQVVKQAFRPAELEQPLDQDLRDGAETPGVEGDGAFAEAIAFYSSRDENAVRLLSRSCPRPGQA
jgi:hypothetical protein